MTPSAWSSAAQGLNTMHNEAYLALGSNMGDRLTYIRQALLMMDNHPAIRLVALSSVYETKPVGFVEQADFLN